MAYRLREDESVAKGLRRVVRKELGSAIDQLASAYPSDHAIHEARKSIKKVRAVLQLVGDDIGARSAMKPLRRAGRLLAPLRDAEAVMASARALCLQERGTLSLSTCSALRDMFRREKSRVKAVATRDRVARRAARALRGVRDSASGWDWKSVGFSVLAADVRQAYKRARRGMRLAHHQRTSENSHEWRKRVKTLWYALRLLQGRAPLRRTLGNLERLQGWLGDEHNLFVLGTSVADPKPDVEGARRARVRHLADRRRQALRHMALAVGAQVFEDSPKQFTKRLRRLWRAADDQTRAHRRTPRKARRGISHEKLARPAA